MTAANSKLEGCRLWIAPVFLFFLAWLTPALPRAAPLTGDAENGKYVAETQQKCVRCHGPNGVSDDPDTPHLAGQNANYLLKELKDFKSETRRKAYQCQDPANGKNQRLESGVALRAARTGLRGVGYHHDR